MEPLDGVGGERVRHDGEKRARLVDGREPEQAAHRRAVGPPSQHDRRPEGDEEHHVGHGQGDAAGTDPDDHQQHGHREQRDHRRVGEREAEHEHHDGHEEREVRLLRDQPGHAEHESQQGHHRQGPQQWALEAGAQGHATTSGTLRYARSTATGPRR